MMGSLVLSNAHAALPAPYSNIKNLYSMTDCTIQGGSPVTMDPACAYDTASSQLLEDVYDTLIFFNGEHMTSFIGVLATSWTIENITVSGAPGTLDNPYNVYYQPLEAGGTAGSRTWFYRYTFILTPNAQWQDPTYGNVTGADVAYSFKREMILDYAGGPQWMMNEPLLGNAAGVDLFNIGNATNPGPDAAMVGHMIDDSVQYNSTAVWLNIGYPSQYAPELGILAQTWSDVLSEKWIQNYVIGTLHLTDWNGNFGADYTGWLSSHLQTTSPTDLDYSGTSAGALMMGSGPYHLTKLDYADDYWTVDWNPTYYRGWPAPFPVLGPSKPAGYVTEFTVTWAYAWPTASAMFEAGDVDILAIPAPNLFPQLYQNPSGPYYTPYPPSGSPNYPLNGIRCIFPLPTLDVDGLFFQFTISPSSTYGTFLPDGTFGENGIPYDFFGNPTWGLQVRQAFAYSIDYSSYVSEVFLGEASTPATAIIPGLADYNPAVTGYNFNLTQAAALFKSVDGGALWNTGFTITLAYNSGNTAREDLADMLKANIESLNPKFHVVEVSVVWNTYIVASITGQLSAFIIGWAPDYPDPNDYAAPFYVPAAGAYAAWQMYDDPKMDALVAQGISTSEGPARAAVYTAVEKLAVQDCSFVPTDQPSGRHFERDWVCGWYWNPVYGPAGPYPYVLWKWYYIPQALSSTVVQPQSYQLPYDTNYDGVIDMKDIGTVAHAFGTTYGLTIDPRWVYRGDANNDRTIDMKDIGAIARNFGKKSAVWVPPPSGS